jgi:hypothetical protein
MEPQNQPPQSPSDQQGNLTVPGEPAVIPQAPPIVQQSQSAPTQQAAVEPTAVQPLAPAASPQSSLLLSSPATFIEGGMPDRINHGTAGAAALAQQYKGGVLHVLTDRIEFVGAENVLKFSMPFASISQVLFIKKYRVFRFVTPSGTADILMRKSGTAGAKIIRPLKSRILTFVLPGVLGVALLSLVSAYGSIGLAFVVLLAFLCFVVLPIYVYGLTKKIKQESQQLRTILEKYVSVTDA